MILKYIKVSSLVKKQQTTMNTEPVEISSEQHSDINIDKVLHTIIEHNMVDEIYKYKNFNLTAFLENSYIDIILKNFTEHAIGYVFNNFTTDYNAEFITKVCKSCVYVSIVMDVIDKVSDVNELMNGSNILHLVCNRYHKNLNLIKFAIDKGCNPMIENKYKSLPIDITYKYANSKVDLDIFKYYETIYPQDIILKNPYIKYVCKSNLNGETLLYVVNKYSIKLDQYLFIILAAQNINVIKSIMDNKKNKIDLRKVYNAAPIICERFSYDLDLIQYFEKLGVNYYNFNKYGGSTLSIVSRVSNKTEVIKYFIDYYIKHYHDINTFDKFSRNPLLNLILYSKNIDAAKYIISKPECNLKITIKVRGEDLNLTQIVERADISEKEKYLLKKCIEYEYVKRSRTIIRGNSISIYSAYISIFAMLFFFGLLSFKMFF